MKTVTLLLGILVSIIAINVNAQELPKTGAALSASSKSVELHSGQSTQIELNRLRSKSYQKATFGAILVSSPEGIDIKIVQDEVNQDAFTLTVAASESLANGKYTLTIQAEGRNASKVKGTMVSVLVNGGENLAQSK